MNDYLLYKLIYHCVCEFIKVFIAIGKRYEFSCSVCFFFISFLILRSLSFLLIEHTSYIIWHYYIIKKSLLMLKVYYKFNFILITRKKGSTSYTCQSFYNYLIFTNRMIYRSIHTPHKLKNLVLKNENLGASHSR